MDQHQHRDRLSSQSEREPGNPICLPVSDPHKAHGSPSTCSACAPPSPSTSAYPSTSAPSHRHLHPAITSTPQTNEANTLFPPHYITSSFSTPRRTSSVLPSPFLVPSPVLPTLLTITSTSSEMFHCACTDGDDEVDLANGTSHVSLLFANLPQPQQKPSRPLQRSSKSSADVHSMGRRRESDLREKEPIPPLFPINPPHRNAVVQAPFEGYFYSAADAQMRDRHPDRESVWSSAESSSLPSPIPSNHQPLTPSPSPSPPFYSTTMSHITSPRGRARNNTHPTTTVPLPNQSHQPPQSHSQSHWQRQQVTPPPTPPAFDARGAAAKLRTIDGYVSFANVEGLGGPPGVEEEVTEEDRRRGTWWPWRGRSRSGSLTTT
ncbi:hypothetical protein BJV77DRAFT_997280 [Russula vinacea]|nr:hypothetical protein BJV77DRAFT_997280 [Russula vinacea]